MNIYPSLINAPLLHLEKTIKSLEPWCAGFHIDIMDFHFVPNLTWGPLFVNAIRKATSKQLWIHLMVDSPERYIPLFCLNPQDIISVHIESISVQELPQLLTTLHNNGLQTSIALKPETDIAVIKNFIPLIDQVLLMSVQPGFSGQTFLPEIYSKLTQLYTLKTTSHAPFKIALDGGITSSIFQQLKNYHTTDIAMASALFNQKESAETILKKLNKL